MKELLEGRSEFTSVVEQDGEWFIGYSPEISGANGQGHTIEECRASLSRAISLIMEDKNADSFKQ